MVIGIFLIAAVAVLGSNLTVDTISARAKPDKPPGKPDGGDDGEDPSTPWTVYGESTDKFALCIGISDYDKRRNDLNYCDDDAMAWKDFLVARGWQVLVLLDRKATADNMELALIELDNLEDSADQVMVTYSGHGYWYDATYGSCWISTDMWYITHGWVDMMMDNLEAGQQFVFTDACESGDFNYGMAQNGRIATSGAQGSGTYTYDVPEFQMGAFTYFALANNPATAEDASRDACNGFNDWLGENQATWSDGVSGDFVF
jgi:hypothetical protein